MSEIKDTKDIIYDNYKIHHTKLKKGQSPKEHDNRKWISLTEHLRLIDQAKLKTYEDIIKLCKLRIRQKELQVGDGNE